MAWSIFTTRAMASAFSAATPTTSTTRSESTPKRRSAHSFGPWPLSKNRRDLPDHLSEMDQASYLHRQPGSERSVGGDARQDRSRAGDMIGGAAQRVILIADEHGL